MSEDFLVKVLSGEINLDKVTKWLRTGTSQDEDMFASCSRIDFVLYFISYLRSQTSSILQQSSNPNTNTTPGTPIQIIPTSFIKEKLSEEITIEKSQSIDKTPKTICTPIKSRLDNETHHHSSKINSTCLSLSCEATEVTGTPNKQTSAKKQPLDIGHQIESSHTNSFVTPNKNISLESSLSNVSPISPNSSGCDKSELRFSTPNNSLTWNKSLNIQSTPVNSFNSNSSRINDIHYKQSNSTPNHKTYVNKTYRQHQYEYNHQRNYSQDTKLSGNNKTQQQSMERPTSQRTNICIGDFIVSNNNAADKSGGKKKKHKYVNLSLDENHFKSFSNQSYKTDNNVLNINDENSFPDIGANKIMTRHQPRRRINPTRLNMSDHGPVDNCNTLITSNIKFGIKCDKSEQNEAFKNQIFCPKEQNTNFNTERNILKAEKEKLLQKFNTLSGSSAKSNLGKISLSRIITNIPQKISTPVTLISPDPQSITNIRALDVLSFLYSVILDLNLVVNFASEINFLISLLVSQSMVSSLENGVENSNSVTLQLLQNSDDKVCMSSNSDQNLITNPSAESEDVTKLNSNSNFVDVSKLLTSIHNCVYFSLKTLNHQLTVLDFILDDTTMRMLQHNLQVKLFSPSLSEHLEMTCALRQTLVEHHQSHNSSVILNKNVCFITDTDTEDNFQTQQSFYTFKKQRDLFYDILRCWESQHNSANWNFNVKVGAMIRTLLNMSVSSSNLAHLARLFREQLIATCTGRKTIDEDSLPEVAGVSADRLNKLAQRLVAAPAKNLSNKDAKPDFPQHQEFYRDFLIIADSAGFRQHVVDSLIEEIYRLNNTHFTSTENEKTVNNTMKMQYLSCVISLQVLGKFLGLVMSLPYRNPLPLPPASSAGQRHTARDLPLFSQVTVPKEKVLQSDIHVRFQTQPPINLLGVLISSKRNRRLILTIPWVVQLLSMLDYSTLRLPYYKHVIYLIFQQYQESINIFNLVDERLQSSSDLNTSKEVKTTQTSQILLKITIGWFFDLLHFPQHLFYSWFRNRDMEILNKSASNSKLFNSHHEGDVDNIVNDLSNVRVKDDCTMNEDAVSKQYFTYNNEQVLNREGEVEIHLIHKQDLIDEQCGEEFGLDFLDLVDNNVILNVCPHLKELKCLLKNNREVSGTDTKAYRHITPVTSTLTQDTIRKNKGKQIQTQLEEWFLRSQSQSTCRILRSVGERVGSVLVRLVRSQISHLKYLSQQGALHHSYNTKETSLAYEVDRLNTQLLKVFRLRCIYAAKCCSRERAVSALRGMLPPATATPVFNLLVELSVRRAIDCVTEWLNNNTNREMLSTEIDVDNIKVSKNFRYDEIQEFFNVNEVILNQTQNTNMKSEPNTSPDIENNFYSGANCIVKIKELCLELITGIALQKGVEYSTVALDECLHAAELCSRCTYIQALTKRTIGQLSLDMIILIISLFPSLLTNQVFSKLKIIWGNCLQNNVSMECIVDIPLSADSANKGTTNDELALFQKYMSFGSQTSNIGDVDESLALLGEDSLGVLSKTLDDAHNSMKNCETNADDSSAKDSETETVLKNCEFFDTILCSRNIMYFGEMGSGSAEVWKVLSQLLAFLLKNKFITEESLTEQCLAVYREEWPQRTLENLSTCIKDLSQMYKMSSEKLQLFLDFVVEFCDNICC